MREKQMKSRVFALVLGLATGWIGVGTSAKAFEFNGSWATAASSCRQVFVKKDGVISFRQDSDQYGGGFILESDRIRGQMQTCTVIRRKAEGDVVHMIAKCADDIMTSNVQFSAKIVDDNTIARVSRECLSSL
jgi:hypothetical protein